MMICKKCKKEKAEDQFYPYCPTRCKECIISAVSKWIKNNPEKAKNYQNKRKKAIALYQSTYYREWYAKNGRKRSDNYLVITENWRKKNKEKVNVSHNFYYYAITKGLIERPLECSCCGRQAKILAHHEDYEKPFEINWLCASCHKKIHIGKLSIDSLKTFIYDEIRIKRDIESTG